MDPKASILSMPIYNQSAFVTGWVKSTRLTSQTNLNDKISAAIARPIVNPSQTTTPPNCSEKPSKYADGKAINQKAIMLTYIGNLVSLSPCSAATQRMRKQSTICNTAVIAKN